MLHRTDSYRLQVRSDEVVRTDGEPPAMDRSTSESTDLEGSWSLLSQVVVNMRPETDGISQHEE